MMSHLGGYVSGPHGDEATWYPDMWKWAVRAFGVKSVLDVGCGEGHSTRFFESLGCEAVGVDGVAQDDDRIYLHDFTTGPFILRHYPPTFYDLIWSAEFVEHVDEQYAHNLAKTFRQGRTILMTHAFPGQAGHHHVNCRTSEYWKGFFTGLGFSYLPGATLIARAQAAINPSPWNHFVRSGMVFGS